MICPNCGKENAYKYATVCAYCGAALYENENAEEKAKELAALQKKDKANSVIKALLAGILAIVIVIVALIIPKPDKDTDGDAPGTTESTTVSGADTNSGDNNGGASANPGVADDSSKDSKTTAEVIDYFNKNANRVKTEATKVVKNYEKRNINKVEAPSVLQSMVDPMKDKFMQDDTDPITYSGREEIVANFQVPNQNYVSCLTESDVKEATMEDKGDYYEITIVANDTTNPTAGKGVGAAFDVIETNEVEGKSESSMVQKFSTEYSGCTIVAKFDKATNRMTSATYTIPTKLLLTVNMFGTHDISLDMCFVKDYTITY